MHRPPHRRQSLINTMQELADYLLLQENLLTEISESYAQIPSIGPAESPDVPLNLESRHVMVIDDEPINIKLVPKVLQDVGFFHFSNVTDPREALSMIRSECPDVILLDIMMPHINVP